MISLHKIDHLIMVTNHLIEKDITINHIIMMETDHLTEKGIITIDNQATIDLIEILKAMEIDHLIEMDKITDHIIIKTMEIDHLIEMDKDNLDLEEDHLMKEELKRILKI